MTSATAFVPTPADGAPPEPLRRLVVVLGDQLDDASAAFEGFDPAQDAVWLCECPAEATYAWSHKARIALFLSAMRHFAARLRDERGWRVHYLATGTHPHATLAEALAHAFDTLRPQAVRMVEAGEWRLEQDFAALSRSSGVPFEVLPDTHFLLARVDYEQWLAEWRAPSGRAASAPLPPQSVPSTASHTAARGDHTPRMEDFYRWMRRRTGLLMQGGGQGGGPGAALGPGMPAGGAWNYDTQNRKSFGTQGPQGLPVRLGFPPDALTREVLALVEARYAEHPGSLAHFDWPVTREEALEALDEFVTRKLPRFGPHQDAMWQDAPWLWHSHLASALNLKLLSPREVCEAAERAWREGEAPLASVEGFVRQILGWREYVHGVYWQRMPAALDDDALGATQPLPGFYWTGDTDAACLRASLGQTLAHGYAHHIQRLMVIGLFALLLGVRPREVHGWFLAVYVDAVEWVELPNSMAMSQFADGGRLGSKPYVASGKYIQRMSNYCAGCRYDPALATGPTACPFTTLYWDFLDRHGLRFASHQRLGPQVRNLGRKSVEERDAIRAAAGALRTRLAGESPAVQTGAAAAG